MSKYLSNKKSTKKAGHSKAYVILIIFLCLFLIFSVLFMFISVYGGAGIHIGSLFPMIYSSALLFVTLIRDGLRKILKILYKPLIAIFYSGCILFAAAFAVFCVLVLGYSSDEIPEDKADLVIVLGCQTYGYRPSDSLESRLKTALETLNKYSGANCVVAGGQGPDETIPEAESMRNYLEERGIDAERIYKEDKSSSTYKNLIFAKEIINEYEISHRAVIIVTNEYHVPRASMIAKRVGFEVYSVKAPTPPLMFGASIMREFFAFFKSLAVDTVK